jgi:hypothetical protein
MKQKSKYVLIAATIMCLFAIAGASAQTVNIPWDWADIVGTGQSLSVGANASPAVTTTQPFNNLKIDLASVAMPPFDPTNSLFKMVPLVEPIRVYGFWAPNGYPGNIFGETPHTAMADQITTLVKTASGKDYITVHTVVGESGQAMTALIKGATDTGSSGRAYAATIFEVTANKRLAAAAGKTFGVGAVIITHGESDSGNHNYENQLYQLWSDYNTDLRAITGQSQTIPMFVSQQHSSGNPGTTDSMVEQWKAGVDYPGSIVCIGPKYHLAYYTDGIHLVAKGYQELGEKNGEVYYQKVVLGNNWQPLQPVSVSVSGRVITVNFNVPVAPLVWDTTMTAPNQSTDTEWSNGKGFEIIANGSSRIAISSVAISGNSVLVTSGADIPATGASVAYAYTSGGTMRTGGTYRWGLLRDSDPFVGYTTGVAQPNYCVSFILPLDTTATPAPTTVPATPAPTASGGTLGDVNSSGSVDIVDALLVAQYYVGLNPAGFVVANADVNKDGSIDIVDALRIAQCYVGLGSCVF